MPIAIQRVVTFAAPGGGSDPWTVSVQVDAGSDLAIYVFPGTTTNRTISGVSRDAQNFTDLTIDIDDGTGNIAGILRLLAPNTGTSDLSIDWSSAARGGATIYVLEGVNQATPEGTGNTANASSDAPSVVVNSAAGEWVLDGAMAQTGDSTTASVGANQTDRANFIGSPGAVANSTRSISSSEPGAASVTMSWTLSASRPWITTAVPVKPASSGLSIPIVRNNHDNQ